MIDNLNPFSAENVNLPEKLNLPKLTNFIVINPESLIVLRSGVFSRRLRFSPLRVMQV